MVFRRYKILTRSIKQIVICRIDRNRQNDCSIMTMNMKRMGQGSMIATSLARLSNLSSDSNKKGFSTTRGHNNEHASKSFRQWNRCNPDLELITRQIAVSKNSEKNKKDIRWKSENAEEVLNGSRFVIHNIK